MEVFDNPASSLAFDVHLDALGVRVRRRGRDGNAGRCRHHFEGWGFKAHACCYAECERFGRFGFEEAGALDDAGDLFASAVAGCAEIEHGDGEVVVLRADERWSDL